MRRILSKIAAFALAICMIAGSPTAAFAEETAAEAEDRGSFPGNN